MYCACVRWKDVVQQLKDEHVKTAETLSLWREFTHLSDQCSLQLQKLWHQREELSRCSPQQDTQAAVKLVEVSSRCRSESLNV